LKCGRTSSAGLIPGLASGLFCQLGLAPAAATEADTPMSAPPLPRRDGLRTRMRTDNPLLGVCPRPHPLRPRGHVLRTCGLLHVRILQEGWLGGYGHRTSRPSFQPPPSGSGPIAGCGCRRGPDQVLPWAEGAIYRPREAANAQRHTPINTYERCYSAGLTWACPTGDG
jgi:hypothetical protein